MLSADGMGAPGEREAPTTCSGGCHARGARSKLLMLSGVRPGEGGSSSAVNDASSEAARPNASSTKSDMAVRTEGALHHPDDLGRIRSALNIVSFVLFIMLSTMVMMHLN